MFRGLTTILVLSGLSVMTVPATADDTGCVESAAGGPIARRVRNFLDANSKVEQPGGSNSTGNRDLDMVIARIMRELAEDFDARPNYYYIKDVDNMGNPAPNAYAYRPGLWQGQAPDGTVLIGLNLLNTTVGPIQQFDASKKFGQPDVDRATIKLRAVLAHECGHIVQFKAANVHYAPFMELEADRLAGWHIGRFCDALKIEYKPEDLSLRGDTGFTDPWHHGTRLERELLFTSGTIDRSPHIHAAYRSTLDYLLPKMADVEFLRHAFPMRTAHLPATGNLVLGRDCGIDQFGIYHKGLQGDWTVDWQYIDRLQQAKDEELVSGAPAPGESAEARARRLDGALLRLGRRPAPSARVVPNNKPFISLYDWIHGPGFSGLTPLRPAP